MIVIVVVVAIMIVTGSPGLGTVVDHLMATLLRRVR